MPKISIFFLGIDFGFSEKSYRREMVGIGGFIAEIVKTKEVHLSDEK